MNRLTVPNRLDVSCSGKPAKAIKNGTVVILSMAMAVSIIGNAALAQMTKVPVEGVNAKAHPYNRDSYQQLQKPPNDFDVPVYTSHVVTAHFGNIAATTGMHTETAVIKTKDPASTAYEWYEASVPSYGWQIDRLPRPLTGIPENAEIFVLRAHKDKQMLFLTCTRLPKVDGTVINLSVSSR